MPIGHISGVHGTNGWVKIYSLTEPREAIFEYQPWLLGDQLEAVQIQQGKKHGKHLIAMLEKVQDRDRAESLVNRQIAIYRDQLPRLPDEQFYWTDLVGLVVQLEDGTNLGTVRNMLATGANDVMVVQGALQSERERLIPFVLGPYVKSVDLDRKLIVVDWDPDF
ncbi:MAG: ribosome maturation factor RimM [Xanthomonadales bacterium]